MNTPIVDHESAPYVPGGHPVRSFALLLVGAGVLALALWWSGLLAPRLHVDGSWAGSFDTETLEGDVMVSVRNAGPLPLRLEHVTVSGPGYRSTGAGLISPDLDADSFDGRELPVFEATELAAGESAELHIGFAVDECRTVDPEVELGVRTAAGVHRSVDLGERDQMETTCADPDAMD